MYFCVFWDPQQWFYCRSLFKNELSQWMFFKAVNMNFDQIFTSYRKPFLCLFCCTSPAWRRLSYQCWAWIQKGVNLLHLSGSLKTNVNYKWITFFLCLFYVYVYFFQTLFLFCSASSWSPVRTPVNSHSHCSAVQELKGWLSTMMPTNCFSPAQWNAWNENKVLSYSQTQM